MGALFHYSYVDNSRYKREAERQVRVKFPGLIEGTSGWHRAVENRLNRLKRF